MKNLRHLLIALSLVAGSAFAADTPKAIFGVELGSRFNYPACDRGEDALTKRHCYNAKQTVKTAWGTEEQQLFYPRASIVPYARGELTVEVVNGVIEAVHVHTWGIEAQSNALDALKQKYGPPARSHSRRLTPSHKGMEGPMILSMGHILKIRVRFIHIAPSIGRSKAANEVPDSLSDYHGSMGQ